MPATNPIPQIGNGQVQVVPGVTEDYDALNENLNLSSGKYVAVSSETPRSITATNVAGGGATGTAAAWR